MLPDRLDNYLRTYRKRAGLSQDDVAFLLGSHSGTKVSRYESAIREPSLDTLLALEAIFGVPVAELFAGRFETVQRKVRKRTEDLLRLLDHLETNGKTRRKVDTLLTFTRS